MYESEASAALHQEEDESSFRRRGLQGRQHWTNVSEASEHICLLSVSVTNLCHVGSI